MIRRYNLTTRTVDRTFNLGGSLNGLDIAPDDSFLLVAQQVYNGTQAMFQKLDVQSGAITNIIYQRDAPGEGGGWDVAIAPNGTALVSSTKDLNTLSAFVHLRKIDTRTNAISLANDAPQSGSSITQNSMIARGADRTRFYLLQPNISSGPVFTYDSVNDNFGPYIELDDFLDFATGAVNRDGTLLATRLRGRVAIDGAADLTYKHGFANLNDAVVFDASRDILYAVDSTTDQIIAFDSNTYVELFRLPIGENLNPGVILFGTGTLVASADGRFLALETPAGIRLITLPTGTPTPHPTPLPSPTLATRRGMVFDHSGHTCMSRPRLA